MLKFLNMLWKSHVPKAASEDETALRRKYEYFKGLLTKNNASLELLTDLEHLLYEDKPFTLDDVLARTEDLISLVYDIAEDLNALSGGRYPGLFDATEKIGVVILKDLVRRKKLKRSNLILPLRSISHEMADEVGGKAANLGEVGNRANLPVPPGFAISAYACKTFLKHNDLASRIERRMKRLEVKDTERLIQVCEEIRAMILAAGLPPEIRRGIDREMAELAARFGDTLRLSVRSSATCEDSEATFAGQHATVLNVSEANIEAAYKEVVASTFSPRAVYYRRSKGYSDEDVIMAVLCVAMIDAKASGVMYTCDPNDVSRDDILISAAFGLGVSVVDGSGHTDFYRVGREAFGVMGREIAAKERRLVLGDGDGVREEEVPPDERGLACLGDAQISELASYGKRLEDHYGLPLDIEWALDQQGQLYILQARPLNPASQAEAAAKDQAAEPVAGREIILRAGATAAVGAAAGQAYVLLSEHNLLGVPQGAILVARQTSPGYVPIMDRIRAIVTDVGSVTGHMASVAREFGIPTLVGTNDATSRIRHGEEISVDATNAVVYRGIVPEILKEKPAVNLMRGSPVYKAAQEALKRMAPLNLLDPKAENFAPGGCRTLHDIIRFAHEMGMQEMFRIGDEMDEQEHVAVRLRAGLPLNILVVDLGRGLTLARPPRIIGPEHVACEPLQALLAGMTHKDVRWSGGVEVNVRGFAAIVAESILSDPQADGRMGGPNYAVISKRYLNFNSRLGYHFATIDTFCGSIINDNYITFSFKGGAADIARRSRRAQLIARILKRLGFKVEQKGDLVRGELKKHGRELTLEKLDFVGRLLGSIRLLDMVLSDDGEIDWYVEEFFKGNYAFERRKEPARAG